MNSSKKTGARLTAPVGIKVSVEVDPNAVVAPVDGAIFPPHPVLRQINQRESQIVVIVLYTKAGALSETICVLTVVHVYWYPSGFITGRM